MTDIQEGRRVCLGWYTLYDMHENEWECIRLSHNAWACMWWECMRMTENVWEWLIFRDGGGPFNANLHKSTCMIMYENALDHPIMNEHVCDEHACEWLRMYENDSYSGRGVGHSKLICTIRHSGGCVRMHYTISSWMNMYVMRMHESDWEWLRIAHIQGGGGGHSRLIYIIRHAWECMRKHRTIS